VKNTGYEVHHYAVFSTIRLPFRSKYPPQHSVLKHPQSTFLPQSERPSFAPINSDAITTIGSYNVAILTGNCRV